MFELQIQLDECHDDRKGHGDEKEDPSFTDREIADRDREEQHELPADIALNGFLVFFKHLVSDLVFKICFLIDAGRKGFGTEEGKQQQDDQDDDGGRRDAQFFKQEDCCET